jgi:hypothetical protein
MPPRSHDHVEDSPKLTRKVDPNEVKIRTDERPTRLLTCAIFLNFSLCVKTARYIVTRMTYDTKSITKVEKSMRGIDEIKSHSVVVGPAAATCLIIDTSRDREIIVAPRRKLVIIVNRKFAASTSSLGCSNRIGKQEQVLV